MKELAGNLIIRNGKILLLRRKDIGHWEVPGGKVEEGESPTETAVRTAEEKICVRVELRKPFYSGEFQHDDELFLWHGYIAEIVDGELKIQEEKLDELEWFKPSDLDDLELAPNLEMILPALRNL